MTRQRAVGFSFFNFSVQSNAFYSNLASLLHKIDVLFLRCSLKIPREKRSKRKGERMYLAASPDTGKDIAVHRHRYRRAQTQISRGADEDIKGHGRRYHGARAKISRGHKGRKAAREMKKKEKFHARFPKEMLNFERNKVAFAWESAVST